MSKSFYLIFAMWLAILCQSSRDTISFRKRKISKLCSNDSKNLFNSLRSNVSVKEDERHPDKCLDAPHNRHWETADEQRSCVVPTIFWHLCKGNKRRYQDNRLKLSSCLFTWFPPADQCTFLTRKLLRILEWVKLYFPVCFFEGSWQFQRWY